MVSLAPVRQRFLQALSASSERRDCVTHLRPRNPAEAKATALRPWNSKRGGWHPSEVQADKRIAGAALGIALITTACSDSPVGPSSGTRVEAVVQDSTLTSPTVTGTLAGNVSASVWD